MTAKFTSERIKALPPYLFARIDEMKQNALKSGIDVIDLGVGDPDLRPPKGVIDSLKRNVDNEGSQNYSSYSGLPRLRKAFADWFEGRFGVELDCDREVLPLIGSKEGIGHVYLSALNPGETVLLPDPGYPVYTAAATLAGVVPRVFPLRPENDFLPDMEEIRNYVTPGTKMMWFNYPSNPTTAMADLSVFEGMVEFAKANDILLCHDTAYSEIVFDGQKAPSVMQVPGAKDTAIEFHSLSKTFCMPGWRVGFVVGNPDAIAALAKVKTNLDSGIFIPVQEAAITALTECRNDARELCGIFEKRRNRFVAGLNEIGWKVPMPPSTFYVWASVPRGYDDSMSFTAALLEKTGIVCTPGVGFGKFGEGFVRMSLTSPDELLDAALDGISKMNIDWTV